MRENRRVIDEPAVVRMLAHPLRLDLLNHLMAAGPATASQCARAVGDTPSNCSYHLRLLARHGLVADDGSGDGRERPWRALLTGFSVPDSDDEAATALGALAVQRDQQLTRRALATQRRLPAPWRAAATHSTYGLRLSATELTDLVERLDALIRPYLSATRTAAPTGAEPVHLGLHAFPTDATLLSTDAAAAADADADADTDTDTDTDTADTDTADTDTDTDADADTGAGAEGDAEGGAGGDGGS
jgi:DNA-binding transcriptional ArsR family regulator